MRRGFKLLLWMMLGALCLVLLLAAAWVASNGRWADAAPRPVPAELIPQAVTLAPEANAFFDGQGLLAPPGESPNAWGQRIWRDEAVDVGLLLPLLAGEDWTCNATKVDCVAKWRASAQALAAQMASAKVFGERCQALVDRPGYQEPVPVRRARAPASELAVPYTSPQLRPLSTCLRWLEVEAVLAPDVQAARAAWARADALMRRVAAGSQTLLGHAIAWGWITRQQALLAQWAAHQPAGSDALPAALLNPLPARMLQPRSWMAAEALVQRQILNLSSSVLMFDMKPNALQAWAGRQSLGYLPELTQQSMNAHWLAQIESHGSLQGAALVLSVRNEPEPEAMSWWSVSWRNPVGNIFIHVARPSFARYLMRQADVVLYQTALALSQRLNALPAAQRAGWLAGQALDTGIRERLSLTGDALLVRTWQGDVEPDHSVPVRFPLRPG